MITGRIQKEPSTSEVGKCMEFDRCSWRIQAPAEWAKDSTPQTLELHMSLHPVVAGDCSIAIGVLKSLFDSDS